MKRKVWIVLIGFLVLSPSLALSNSDVFKPGSENLFQALLRLLNANASSKFTDYDTKTQKNYDGYLFNFLTFSKDYKDKFEKLVANIDTYSKKDLADFIAEVENEFAIVEAVRDEHERLLQKRPNKPMNTVLVEFSKMFIVIVKTLEATVIDDSLVESLRKRVRIVEKDIDRMATINEN